MRKLVVLLLVVGSASVSFGGLEGLPNTSYITATLSESTLTIGGIVAPAPSHWWFLGIGYDGTIATESGGVVSAAAGQLGSINLFPAAPAGFDIAVGDYGGTAATPGNWFNVNVTGVHVGSQLSVWDYGRETEVPPSYIAVTPEPSTFVILSLALPFFRAFSRRGYGL